MHNLFGDIKRKEDLYAELGSIYQERGESVNKFASRVHAIGREMIRAFTKEKERIGSEVKTFKEEVNTYMRINFRRGLKEEIDMRLPSKAFEKLEALVKAAVEIDEKNKIKQAAENRRPFRRISTIRSKDPRDESYSLEADSDKEETVRVSKVSFKRGLTQKIQCPLCHEVDHSALDCPYNPKNKKKLEFIICGDEGHIAKNCLHNPMSHEARIAAT